MKIVLKKLFWIGAVTLTIFLLYWVNISTDQLCATFGG